jgi:hypothetical protein
VQGRFSAPFFPCEALRVDIWSTGPGALAFEARAVKRDALGSMTGR